MIDPDTQFFTDHPLRRAHIRKPATVLHVDKRSHVTRYLPENEAEFRSLGEHNKDRRRIVCWRVPPEHPLYDAKKCIVLKIPLLLWADESVEDDDTVLLPIIEEMMRDAAKNYALLSEVGLTRH